MRRFRPFLKCIGTSRLNKCKKKEEWWSACIKVDASSAPTKRRIITIVSVKMMIYSILGSKLLIFLRRNIFTHYFYYIGPGAFGIYEQRERYKYIYFGNKAASTYIPRFYAESMCMDRVRKVLM